MREDPIKTGTLYQWAYVSGPDAAPVLAHLRHYLQRQRLQNTVIMYSV